MGEYRILAKVDQIVTREVHLLIVADSKDEAEGAARDALQVYPEALAPSALGKIRRLVVKKSYYWIPRSIDLEVLDEEKSVA